MGRGFISLLNLKHLAGIRRPCCRLSTSVTSDSRRTLVKISAVVRKHSRCFCIGGHSLQVQVMVGKDAGKQGIVDMIIKERNWCYVQGLNCDYREVTAEKVNDPRYPPTLYAIEKPLLVTTEVKLVDPEDNYPTEIDWRFSEDGEEVRVSRRTGRIIGFPLEYENLTEGDFVNVKSYKANRIADTPETELTKITFKPTLATFEQDLMKKFDIKEDRKRPKTYWY